MNTHPRSVWTLSALALAGCSLLFGCGTTRPAGGSNSSGASTEASVEAKIATNQTWAETLDSWKSWDANGNPTYAEPGATGPHHRILILNEVEAHYILDLDVMIEEVKTDMWLLMGPQAERLAIPESVKPGRTLLAGARVAHLNPEPQNGKLIFAWESNVHRYSIPSGPPSVRGKEFAFALDISGSSDESGNVTILRIKPFGRCNMVTFSVDRLTSARLDDGPDAETMNDNDKKFFDEVLSALRATPGGEEQLGYLVGDQDLARRLLDTKRI